MVSFQLSLYGVDLAFELVALGLRSLIAQSNGVKLHRLESSFKSGINTR
jgi:hypothetical protein